MTELRFNRVERAVFSRSYRGKLRLARVYSRLSGLHRRPFRGVADVPFGRLHVDTRLRDDWALLFGGMEGGHLPWLREVVTAGAHTWDVGAHHGYYSVELGRLVTERGAVHAFEPFPESAEIVARNVALNGLETRVSVHAAAVGARVGTGALQLSPQGPQNHSLTSALDFRGDTVEVPVTTLDAELARLGPPDFVKIDVEGGESVVLEGAKQLLELRRTTFLFESELWNENRAAAHELFRAHGYTLTSLVGRRERPGTEHRMLVARPSA